MEHYWSSMRGKWQGIKSIKLEIRRSRSQWLAFEFEVWSLTLLLMLNLYHLLPYSRSTSCRPGVGQLPIKKRIKLWKTGGKGCSAGSGSPLAKPSFVISSNSDDVNNDTRKKWHQPMCLLPGGLRVVADVDVDIDANNADADTESWYEGIMLTLNPDTKDWSWCWDWHWDWCFRTGIYLPWSSSLEASPPCKPVASWQQQQPARLVISR